MSSTTVSVKYAGPVLATGAMEVRHLAPALISISDLLQEANNILNEDAAKLAVQVKSDFKTGSFEIGLELVQSLADQVKFLANPKGHYDITQILEFIGATAGASLGLIALIKWVRRREIDKVSQAPNGNLHIHIHGEIEALEVSEQTVKLYRSKKVRKNIQQMLEPLEQEGIDKFAIREKDKEFEEILKEEVPFFEAPEIPDEEIIDTTIVAAFNVIGVFFEEGLKWRLYDGENKINAIIRDDVFLSELDKGRVSFTKGDILKVELRTKQWSTDRGLKKEHEVIKVLKQIKAAEQIPLPFESSEHESK